MPDLTPDVTTTPNFHPLKGTPMTLDPTLRDQLAKTIHDAVCPCAHFLDRHPATRKNYLDAADKAAELLTTPRFPDGWERGHEAKYWAQTGLTPYGLTLDPERAPGVLNWLGVNYYTPDSPHLPASAAAPVVLPTVEEVARTIMLDDGYPHREMDPAYLTNAQAVLDLIASRVRHWVPVEPGTLIKAGTHYRIECGDGRANEYVASCDRKTDESVPVYIDPATVPAEPEDPLTPEKLAELRWLLDTPPQHITIARDDALALLDAAAERDALAESVRAYGRTIDRWGLLIIAATHSEDITTPDGDGDWEVIESRLAEVPALLAERDALAAAVERHV